MKFISIFSAELYIIAIYKIKLGEYHISKQNNIVIRI